MPSLPFRSIILSLLLSTCTCSCLAKNKQVTINSIPEGAEVEVNGSVTCTTPCSISVPDYYFGVKRTAFSKHGIEPITVVLRKKGFASKTIQITTGPIHWKNLNGYNLYDYFLVDSTSYDIELDPVSNFFNQQTEIQPGLDTTAASSAVGAPILANEDIVRKSVPAIVIVSTPEGWGSGFLVSERGVVVTNAHVVGGRSSVDVVLNGGRTVESSSIYIDEDRDLALIKLPDGDYPFLRISHTLPPVGADVLAIGSPGIGSDVMTNTVTKGVVSGIRNFSDGTWIQTDAPLNHGNSGGPLLDKRGEVVGVNTLRAPVTEYSGMNFSLASTEIDKLIFAKFGVRLDATAPTQASTGLLKFTSTPSGADIVIDGVFLGTTPAELPTASGDRDVSVTKTGFKPFIRKVHVLAGANQTISVDLEPESK